MFCPCVEARCKYVPSRFVQFCTTPDHMTANLCRCRRCDVWTAVLFIHIAWGLVRETLRVQLLCFCMLLPLSWHVETSRLGCGAQQQIPLFKSKTSTSLETYTHDQHFPHTFRLTIFGRACCTSCSGIMLFPVKLCLTQLKSLQQCSTCSSVALRKAKVLP